MSSLESIIKESELVQQLLDIQEKNHFTGLTKLRLKNLKKEKLALLKQAGISQSEFHKKYSFISERKFPETINFDSVLAFIDNCKEISLIREIQIRSRIKRQELEQKNQ